MYTDIQQALPRVLSCAEEVKKKWKLTSMVQPKEGEPRAWNEDLVEGRQRRLLHCGDHVKIRTKISRYWMFSLLCLCFVFYEEIYDKSG